MINGNCQLLHTTNCFVKRTLLELPILFFSGKTFYPTICTLRNNTLHYLPLSNLVANIYGSNFPLSTRNSRTKRFIIISIEYIMKLNLLKHSICLIILDFKRNLMTIKKIILLYIKSLYFSSRNMLETNIVLDNHII